ncbi:MAG: DNA polymerase I [Candidatus Acidulodesulfobacterium acidiphilum]|uniref:DNA polymerase I n=1 Tax=Candidatus Acidulodesulfobacterium acidiphilum TaxID=2597224 RepID=A0A520XHH1_9DELT|nr:MAG: DNA polymerase I [Candidatus Acidulodesulfobacterium acidiphilum]
MEKDSIKADLFLIDSSSYFYRAFYALPPLTNSKGKPTGAALGYTRMLMKLIKEADIKYGACLFDSEESFRKQSYEAYKANRKGMPEDLVSQVDYLTDISYLLGFETFKLNGYEADDLIARTVKNFEGGDASICIVSSDKDLKQLLSDKVFMYDALKNKIITKNIFEEENGIKPEEYRYVLALMGDASDNIPGIKGIGEKTAFALIKEYKNLDGIYKNIDNIKKPKLKELLLIYKEDAYKSLELASFYEDISLNEAYFIPGSGKSLENSKVFNVIEDFALKEKNKAGLYKVFKELEFNSLIKDLGVENNKTEESDKDTEYTENTIQAVSQNYSEDGEFLSVYVDFTEKKKELFDDESNPIYIYSKETGPVSYGLKDIYEGKRLKDLLKDASVLKIGCGLNAAKLFLENNGIEFNGLYFDIKIASYLLNPIKHKHTFEDIEAEFQEKLKPLKSEESNNYALTVYRLYKILKAEIETDDALKRLFNEVDMPLSAVLFEMEKAGFKVDKDMLMSLSASLDSDSKKLTGIIHKIAGREFNINSPKQLSAIMFDEMNFKRVKKNSTDIEVLQTLKAEFEILLGNGNEDKTLRDYLLFLDSLISYRNKVKLKTAFVDVLLREIDKYDRVHTSFSQITTSTGRLASQSPNLQNIPVSGEEGIKIRRSFIAKDGCILLSADYSQIDLRVMASISGDKSLIESFKNNEDIHAKTAGEIFGVGADAVDKDMRRKAKVINFGIIYGMSPFGLSKELGISSEEARHYIDLYFKNHPAIKEYMEKTVKEAKTNGFVRTAFGRKCYIENINSRIRNLSSFSERAAINAPIQGTASDIIKIAMVNIYKYIQNDEILKNSATMLLQVHDELIFEIEESIANSFAKVIAPLMTDQNLLSGVPLSVNIGTAKNWAEAH